MKRFYITLGIAMLIFILAQFPHAMLSPGELSSSHQKLNNECLACHDIFTGISNTKCIGCHNLSKIGNDSLNHNKLNKFHGLLLNDKCNTCHTEHKGKMPILVGNFNHKMLSASSLNNCYGCHHIPSDKLHKQVSNSCSTCHQTNDWKTNTSFNHEALNNKSNCENCHQKPSDNIHSITNLNCNKCHGTNKWKPSTFNHTIYFELDRNHDTKCSNCHTKNSYATYSCFGCHEHSGNDIVREHNEEGIYAISDCVSCHKNTNSLEHD